MVAVRMSPVCCTFVWMFNSTACVIMLAGPRVVGSVLYMYRSHFGSRYKLGCCGHAGLLCAWVRFPAARQQHAQSRGPLCNCSPGEFPRGQAFQPDEPMASPQGADCTCRNKHLKLAWKFPHVPGTVHRSPALLLSHMRDMLYRPICHHSVHFITHQSFAFY